MSITNEKGLARVAVEDFGYGIEDKDKDKVFNRFFQRKNKHVKPISGLGLGLYIANSIVKHHGGSLNFISKRSSKGTIFYFTIPYYKCKINKKIVTL